MRNVSRAGPATIGRNHTDNRTASPAPSTSGTPNGTPEDLLRVEAGAGEPSAP